MGRYRTATLAGLALAAALIRCVPEELTSGSDSGPGEPVDGSGEPPPAPLDGGADGPARDGREAQDGDAALTADAGADTSMYPSSCADLPDAGDPTLYVGHDPAKAWQAHCIGAATYLPVNAMTNASSYPKGGCASVPNGALQSVMTRWSFVRIDPTTLIVDTSDFAGALSFGSTKEVSGNGSFVHVYTQMLYASARSCRDVPPTAALATVDLTGTKFAVSPTEVWNVQGFSALGPDGGYGSADTLDGGAVVDLLVGGYPSGISPCNDFYTDTGGPCLALAYVP